MGFRVHSGNSGGGTPSAIDQTITIGEDDQEFQQISAVFGPQLLGSYNQDHDSDDLNAILTTPLGDLDEADVQENSTGIIEDDLGTDFIAFYDGFNSSLEGLLGGESDADLLANSEVDASVDPSSGTRVDIPPTGGSATWQDPGNATSLGSANSQITDTGELTAAVSFSDELRLTFPAIPGIPAGWSSNSALISVTDGWGILNTGTDLLSTATFTLVMRYTDGTEDTLRTLTQLSSNQAGTQTSTYDITNRYITQGKTPERLMFKAVADIAIAQPTVTKRWTVDVGRIFVSFSRNGIT